MVQLEPAPPPTEDPFSRPYPTHPPPVFVDKDTDTVKSFEVERLLNRRTMRHGRGNSVEYLVCWKNYGLKWDRWYNVKDLNNAAELVLDNENGLQGI